MKVIKFKVSDAVEATKLAREQGHNGYFLWSYGREHGKTVLGFSHARDKNKGNHGTIATENVALINDILREE